MSLFCCHFIDPSDDDASSLSLIPAGPLARIFHFIYSYCFFTRGPQGPTNWPTDLEAFPSYAAHAALKIGPALHSECTKTFLNQGVNNAIISDLHRALAPPSRAPRAFKAIAALARSRADANMFFAPRPGGIIVRSCQVILASRAAGARSTRLHVTHERGVVCLRADRDMTERDTAVLCCAVWCVNTTTGGTN